MKQFENNLFYDIKIRDRKALGLIFIFCFIVFMKLWNISLGRNNYQITRLNSKNYDGTSTDNFEYEAIHKSDMPNSEYIKSSTVTYCNDTDINNETHNQINSDKKTILTNLERVDSKINKRMSVTTTESMVKRNHVDKNLKYILQWTSGQLSPFYHMGSGQDNFFKFKCPYTNCFVTDNKTLLPNLRDYDAIVFNGNYVIQMDQSKLPQERSLKQKYIFAGTEPAAIKLACNPVLDNYFNWTWTYRLDSDFRWGYVSIFDLNGTAVGPNQIMRWPKEMKPIDLKTKMILDGKTKAAAWFVSRCKSPSHREDVVRKISTELKKFSLSVDVYGRCGKLACPTSNRKKCSNLVATDYYFYFSFENSFEVDYVTEKLLTALHNYAIPVVYGGANYSRFLPPGSYLDALKLSPKQLAATMRDIIKNKELHYNFFRWRNHFKYKQTDNCDDVCNVCTALNDQQKVNTISTYKHFRKWWNEEWNSSCKH